MGQIFYSPELNEIIVCQKILHSFKDQGGIHYEHIYDGDIDPYIKITFDDLLLEYDWIFIGYLT